MLRSPLLCLTACLGLAVSCANEETAPDPAPPEALPYAAFDLSARILGSAANDDNSDIEITLRETKGVAFDINFVQLTCNTQVAEQWGAESFVAELGTNRIAGGTTLVFQRHYTCPNSGRPREVVADLTDENGHHLQVNAGPYHPDWPGT
jgi:hypothetical protein